MLGWLCAAAALAYVSRNSIAVAESTVRADLGLTKEQSGWLMSAFFFSYAFCQIPAAQYVQRAGSRRALTLFAAIWSAATALMAFTGTAAGLVATRLVQGISQAGLVPAATVTVAKWFPKTGRAFATGSLGSAMSVGGATCAWLTGVLIEWLDPWTGPGWNWRLTFLIFALPGFFWAAWFWRWFRNEPAEHPEVSETELRLIREDASKPAASAPASVSASPVAGGGVANARATTPWISLLSSPALWWICGQQAFRAAGYIFFTSWFATYLQETRGVGVATSGFLNMLPLLAVVLGGVLGGALSDRLLKLTGRRDVARRWLAAGCLFVCAGLTFWALVLDNALAAVVVISLGSLFAALAAPCAYTITIDMGGDHVATINATMNMMGNLGAWAFPIAVPWLLGRFGSWDVVVLVFGALHAAAAVFWLLLKPEGTILDQAIIRSNHRPPPAHPA